MMKTSSIQVACGGFWLVAAVGCAGVSACSAGSAGGPAAADGGATEDAHPADAPGGTDTSMQSFPDGVSQDVVFEGADAGDAHDITVESGPGCKDGGAMQCAAPAICGPVVQTVEVVQSPPPPLGGTLIPGLYVLTSATVYRASAGGATPTFQIAYSFTSSQFAEASYEDGFEQSPIAGSYETAGAILTRNITCQTSSTATDGYTATSTTLIVYRAPSGTNDTYELVATLQ